MTAQLQGDRTRAAHPHYQVLAIAGAALSAMACQGTILSGPEPGTADAALVRGHDGAPPVDAAPAALCADYQLLGESYTSVITVEAPYEDPNDDRPAHLHPDKNPHLRGWVPTGGELNLLPINGPTDPKAPVMNTLFADERVATFVHNYAVNEWDFENDQRLGPITSTEVSAFGIETGPGEVLRVPHSGYVMAPPAMQVHVLYADDNTITLHYTPADNISIGYTISVIGICVEPTLLDLYNADNAAGRQELPALPGRQAYGRAADTEVIVIIRDTASFMDLRREGWWAL